MWRAWQALHAERSHRVEGVAAPLGGMVIRSRPGVTPWTAIDRYARRHGYHGEVFDFLVECLSAMDAHYIEWWAEKQEAP